MSYVASAALLIGTMPVPLHAQAPAASVPAVPVQTSAQDDAGPQKFNTAQLDALLAPIALYPDTLLTQLLMATTNPLEIVAASRWLSQGNNKELKGAALENALKSQPWDPAVKSLIPFPQVLETLNQQLEWTQQLGFAMQAQQPEVFESIQRLRLQARNAGQLQSTPQQVVRAEPAPPPPPGVVAQPGAPQQVIVIEPAQPDIVYVPAYNPAVVYGAWPYPATPPVYYPPPAGYGYGNALVAGLVFGAGVAITAGLWGWARPNWGCCWGGGYGGGYGNVNINVNRWNNINVNRPWHGGANGAWRPNNPSYRPGGGYNRPGGPVGRPSNPGGMPPNAIGRPGVSVPGSAVRPPAGMGPGNRPGIGQPGTGAGNRPSAGQPGTGAGSRPGGGQAGMGGGPTTRPAPQAPRQPSAFGGMNEGRGAQQYGNRGAQSRQMNAPGNRGAGAGAGRGGGARGGGRR